MRTKAEIIARMNEVGMSQRICAGSCQAFRAVDTGLIDQDKKMVPFVAISANNAGERMDWWTDEIYIEELDVKGAKFDRLRTMFKDHAKSVDNAVARLENARVDAGAFKVDAYFGTDTNSYDVFRKYADAILTDVSVGYIVNDVQITETKGEPMHVLVTDFEVVELSAVWRGFDGGATVGRSATQGGEGVQPKLHSADILRRKLNLKTKDTK
ncbi:peptidase [Sulfurimonas sp. HSL1-6]|uniref:peptidase n=1 Tax=Thiomicrolovo immobilis TaxID=3131935 RepID=UPI0031F88ED2